MNEYDGISIIVPVYNSEKCISDCLVSIINQQYKNLEIICVDDGSTDSSGRILDEFAHKDSRIRVIHKENGGASAARNTGINLATMPIIAFVDSDDTIEPNMYLDMISRMKNERLDCVCCNYKFIKDNKTTAVNSRFSARTLYGDEIKENIVKCLIGFSQQRNNCLSALWNKLFLASIIKEKNISINEKRTHGEDWMFCIEYYSAINSVGFLTGNYYNYFHHTNSLISKPRKNCFELSIESHQHFKKIFPEFDWDSDIKIENLNNLPFKAALHYRQHYKGKEYKNLLENIYYTCKKENYFENIVCPNNITYPLSCMLKNNDIKGFVKYLSVKTEKRYIKRYISDKIKNLIKNILNYNH